MLRPKRRLPLGERLREILKNLPDDPTFVRPEQPPLERDDAWWAENGFAPTPKGSRSRRKSGDSARRCEGFCESLVIDVMPDGLYVVETVKGLSFEEL